MTTELQDALNHLEEFSPKLNAATDKANEVVRLVEDFLNERCSLGIQTWVGVSNQTSIEDDPKGQQDEITVERGRVLSYDRPRGGSFRICLQAVRYEPDGSGGHETIFDGDPVPWAQARREEKLESFAQLPALLQAIVREAEGMLKDAEETVAAAKQIMDAMAKPKNQ